MSQALADDSFPASATLDRFQALLDVLPAAVYATDAQGIVTFANQAAAELAGRAVEIGQDKWCVSWRLFYPDGRPLPHNECPMARALKERRPIRGVELIAERPDGVRVPILPYPTPIFDKTGRLTGAVNLLIDISAAKRTEIALQAQTQRFDVLNRIGKMLAGDLDLERIVQLVTDSATVVSGARFGTLFFKSVDKQGERYEPYASSGTPASAFEKFVVARNAAMLEPTFAGKAIVRSDDLRKDPRHAKHDRQNENGVSITSYLAVPIVSRSGEVHGGLFLGHDRPGIFTKETEQVVAGIAAHAAIAIDNGRLLQKAQQEVEHRRRVDFAQRRLAAIVEFSEDAIIGKDLNGVLTDWNAGAEHLFGYTAAEVVGKPVTILFPADHLDEEPGILARIQRGESIQHYETVRQRKDGTRVDVSLTISPIKDEEGRIIGASKIIRDVTARKRSEEVLARRVNELGATYELIDGLHRAQSLEDMHKAAMYAIFRALRCDRASILLFDDAGVMKFVASQGLSPAYRTAVEGHSPWRPDSINAIPIVEPDIDTADLTRALRSAVKNEGIGALAFIPLVAGGKVIGKFMVYYDQPHQFGGGEMALAVSIANQFSFGVTRWRAEEARRRAEEELRENEERERERAAELQAIMEAAPVSIWITRDPECAIITGNRTANEFLRLAPDAPPHLSATQGEWSENFDMFVGGEPLSIAGSPIQRAAHGEEVRNAEGEIRFKDGTSRFLLGNATPLRDQEGSPYGAVATFVDITERKQMEEALRAREAELEIIINRTPFMLTRCTRDLRYGIVSQAYARMIGRTPEDLVGKAIVEVIGEDGMRTIRPFIERVLEGNRVEYEEEVHFAGVGARFLHAVYTPERDEQGGVTGWIASILDVTERKRAETQRDLLVAELSHRVKNTLATVVSIARQSFAKNPNVEEARRSFDARILALAQTHTRLAETSWSGVLFETLLLDEFEPYRRDDGGNVRLSGPAIALSPVCILTLGMAIHELATNAAKYGALSTKEGIVEVVWDLDLHDRLRIRWTERAGPPVEVPKRIGFGRQLLERATAAGLKGGVELDFAPAGLACTITIPTSGNVMGVL